MNKPQDYTYHTKNKSVPTGNLANDFFSKLSTDRGFGGSISKAAKKDFSEPFKGSELGGVIKGFDKATGWLDKKMSGWAGKKDGEKKN